MNSDPQTALLRVGGLIVDFDAGKPSEHRALDGIDLSIDRGEVLGLVGESSSGKTVLSHAVLGLLPRNGRVTAGSIQFFGRELVGLAETDLRQIRGREIAMIFQDPQASLNPVYQVGKQIEWVLKLHRGIVGPEARAEVLRLFESVKLRNPERCTTAYAHELSGGMAQRVMIAMALACRPKLLIADEPTSALDVTTQVEILSLLKEVRKDHNLSLLFISHDLRIVADLCDRIAVMRTGKIVASGSPVELAQENGDDYLVKLMRASHLTPVLANMHEALNVS